MKKNVAEHDVGFRTTDDITTFASYYTTISWLHVAHTILK